MPREVISTPEAPEYPSYSQAVKVGNTIYVAGTIGVDVATGELAGHTIQEQTRQSLRNCQAILRAGGAELSDAVMVHTLLLRPEDADGVMEVFAPAAAANPPITFIGAGDIAETQARAEASAKVLDGVVAADPSTMVWTLRRQCLR